MCFTDNVPIRKLSGLYREVKNISNLLILYSHLKQLAVEEYLFDSDD